MNANLESVLDIGLSPTSLRTSGNEAWRKEVDSIIDGIISRQANPIHTPSNGDSSACDSSACDSSACDSSACDSSACDSSACDSPGSNRDDTRIAQAANSHRGGKVVENNENDSGPNFNAETFLVGESELESSPLVKAGLTPKGAALPCLQAPKSPTGLGGMSDEVTSPANPVTLQSLRLACTQMDANVRPPVGPSVPDAKRKPAPSRLGDSVIAVATTVHETLGPGLDEQVYRHCFARELERRGLEFERDVPISVQYLGEKIEDAFHVAFVVGGELMVEIRAVDRLLPTHEAQVRNFVAQSGLSSAILFNFHEPDLELGTRTTTQEDVRGV